MSAYLELPPVRVYIGPLAGRPAPSEAGEGAFYTAPDDNYALYQVISGNWIKISRGTSTTAIYG